MTIPSPLFQIGQRVNRIENRASVGAVVISVEYNHSFEFYSYYINYDEGGFGYWNEADLNAA